MSRIGKKPVPVGTAKVSIAGQLVKAEGPKGKLELKVHPLISVAMDDATKSVVVSRKDDERQSRALHGLTRALLANMVEGVTKGYSRNLEIQGVGYKAELKGKTLVLSVGYANQITLDVPSNLVVTPRRCDQDQRLGAPTSRPSASSPPRFVACASPSRTKARASATRASRSRSSPARRSPVLVAAK